jgi:hypothetical protein
MIGQIIALVALALIAAKVISYFRQPIPECGPGCICGGENVRARQEHSNSVLPSSPVIIQQPAPVMQPQPMIILVQQPAPQMMAPTQPQVIYLPAPQPQAQPQQPLYLPAPEPARDYYDERAKERQREATVRGNKNRAGKESPEVANLPPLDSGKARDQVAKTVGVSGKTIDYEPQSYYPGPTVEDYQPEVHYLPPQQPVGQLPPARASDIEEARRKWERECEEMKHRR